MLTHNAIFYGYSPLTGPCLLPNQMLLHPYPHATFFGYQPDALSGYSPVYNPGYSPLLVQNCAPMMAPTGYSPACSSGYAPVNESVLLMQKSYDNKTDTSPVNSSLMSDDELSDALDAGDPLLACETDTRLDFFTSRFSTLSSDSPLTIFKGESHSIEPVVVHESPEERPLMKEIVCTTDIQPLVTGEEITCIQVDELWDMSEILVNILAHYDPSTHRLITNEYVSIETLLPRLLTGRRGEILKRLHQHFQIDERPEKVKLQYETAAGWLGCSIK